MAVKPPKRPRDWEKIQDTIHSGFFNYWGRAGLPFCFLSVGLAMFKLGLLTQNNFGYFLLFPFLLWGGVIVALLRGRVFVPFGWSYEEFRELLRKTGKSPYSLSLGDKRYFFVVGCVVVVVIIASILTNAETLYLGIARPLFLVGVFGWIVVKVIRGRLKEAREKGLDTSIKWRNLPLVIFPIGIVFGAVQLVQVLPKEFGLISIFIFLAVLFGGYAGLHQYLKNRNPNVFATSPEYEAIFSHRREQTKRAFKILGVMGLIVLIIVILNVVATSNILAKIASSLDADKLPVSGVIIELVIFMIVILVPLFVWLERDNKIKTYDEQKKEYRKQYGIKEKKNKKVWHFKI